MLLLPDGFDAAMEEVYDRRFRELVTIEGKGAIEAHQMAVAFALKARPVIVIPPDAEPLPAFREHG